MDEVTEKFVVLYFRPDGDQRQTRPTEDSARRFASREEVREWNPIIEKVTTTIRREFIWNSMDAAPTEETNGTDRTGAEADAAAR